MSIRSLLRQGLPDLAEVDHISLPQQVWASPLLLPVRLFTQALLDFRPWWPVLLPLLALEGLRTYRRERQKYQSEQAAQKI